MLSACCLYLFSENFTAKECFYQVKYSLEESIIVLRDTVQALEVLFNALNKPTQLTGWHIGGGDPCGESWKGLKCEGSAVVSMYVKISPECYFVFLVGYG